MSRLTRVKDRWECRINNCPASEWMENHTIGYCEEDDICKDCPFEKYINRLAEYEDTMEDDLK